MKADILTAPVACDLCGSMDSRLVGQGTDREYATSAASFRVVECTDCGLWYLNPRPDISELGTIYPADYHAYNIRPAASAGAADTRPAVTRLRHWVYSRRFRYPLRFLRGDGPFDMLDIGCGDGWMLDLYRIAGKGKIRTYGVDFNADICAIASSYGHKTYCGRFEDLEMDRDFDVVNMSHVIEHVSSPTQVARKVYEVLRPGGVFVLETPNTDAWECGYLKTGAWGAFHIPRHWNLFNPQTIRRLGESTGFQLREVRFHPAPVHWVWSFHNLGLTKNNALGRLIEKMFAPLDVFRGGVKAFGMLAGFTVLDLILHSLSGRTSNMMAIFEKPTPVHG